jgi:YggT family protein
MNALIVSIVQLLHTLINAYIWLIIIAALMSFIQPDPRNQIVQAIRKLTEPPLQFIRRHIPFVVVSGLDLSPLVIILGLQFIDTLMMMSVMG